MNANGNAQKLIWWLMGVLLVISIGLSGALWGSLAGRLDNIGERQAHIEARIEAIQDEYYRIAVMEAQVTELLELARGR